MYVAVTTCLAHATGLLSVNAPALPRQELLSFPLDQRGNGGTEDKELNTNMHLGTYAVSGTVGRMPNFHCSLSLLQIRKLRHREVQHLSQVTQLARSRDRFKHSKCDPE